MAQLGPLPTLPHDLRIAEDGVLEKMVAGKLPSDQVWVPIVPHGYPTANLTWKKWVFLQAHIGIFGTHRNAKKTYQLLENMVWWHGMQDHIEKWIDGCATCLRFRKRTGLWRDS